MCRGIYCAQLRSKPMKTPIWILFALLTVHLQAAAVMIGNSGGGVKTSPCQPDEDFSYTCEIEIHRNRFVQNRGWDNREIKGSAVVQSEDTGTEQRFRPEIDLKAVEWRGTNSPETVAMLIENVYMALGFHCRGEAATTINFQQKVNQDGRDVVITQQARGAAPVQSRDTFRAVLARYEKIPDASALLPTGTLIVDDRYFSISCHRTK